MRLLAGMFVAISCTSCTFIELHGAERSNLISPGILRIAPAQGAGSVSYRLRGVGMVPTINGVSIGYAQEDAVLVFDPEDCRIIVFDRIDQALLRGLAERDDVCLIEGGRQ